MNDRHQRRELEQLADQKQPSLAVEFLDFLAHNKKWWLLPILLVLGLIGMMAAVATFTGGGAPLIYTLF